MSDDDIFRLLPLAFVVVPAVAFLGAAWRLWSQLQADRDNARVPADWYRADGSVIDEHSRWEYRSSGDGPGRSVLIRQPIVQFRTSMGREVTFTSNLAGRHTPRPGQPVAVYYHPSQPDAARLAPESVPALYRIMSVGGAAVSFVIALVLLVVFESIGIGMLRSG
ncbi:Protein of unknown function [Jatrophihabitans endophyticus]|uniref:DUF3592 domain-containing protein n=1 Tax=Jatrophihabitans endophyticus TaxID=1206085 RepID=A0A1M5H4U7_9ACTN|nr:DUF3592 domain-containing protein [Jatrophihabitans endophyticus]SHG10928.1 Protein of unknown function [Jatrophihabitans endophyticus]